MRGASGLLLTRGRTAMNDLARFSVSIPTDLAGAFDRRISAKGYASRSEAVRDIMREYLIEEEWEDGAAPVIGTVTIVYNHERPELGHTLTRLQHVSHDAIVCTTHIHLDEHNCMEVVVVRGRGDEIRAIAEQLIATKGVKHGKLVCTSAIQDLP
jgi:CopG family transcriptional regulator, nickel-responsive regulator